MTSLDNLNIAIPTEDGRWVSQEHSDIAEIIKDYDDTLELAYIPPDKRIDYKTDPPFAVVCRPRNGTPPYVVFTSQNCDRSILARLFAGDNANGNVLDRIEAEEAAKKAIELKQELEAAEVRQDFIGSIKKSPLNSFKHNGLDWHKPISEQR